jgi:hypothetical protein
MQEKKRGTKPHKLPGRRNRVTYPALDPKYNLKTRQEEIEDIKSYSHLLGPKEKLWMNSFVEEEINANFHHEGKKFNKSKKSKRIVYNKNNARNRDVYTRSKAQNKLVSINDLFWIGENNDD